MKRFACLAATFGAFGIASASVNLNIDLQYQTVVRPSSGSIQVVFTGTVDMLLPTFYVDVAWLETPASASNNTLNPTYDPAFLAYANAQVPGADYVGNLFSVEVASTTPLGFYWLNGGFNNPLSELVVDATDGQITTSDNEMYGVNVVPEPATMAVLGLGAAALLRRRRK